VNDAPVAVNDSLAVNGEGPAVIVDVLSNDTDIDATQSLFVTGVNVATDPDADEFVGAATRGQVRLNPNGTISYFPTSAFSFLAPGETAEDSFTYTVSDGKDTDTATVAIVVTGTAFSTDQNFAPIAFDDQATTSILTGLVYIDALANDTDPNGDSLEITQLFAGGIPGGAVIDDDGQGIFYDPLDDLNGLATGETAEVSFTYGVTDGRGGTDTATVKVTVTGSGSGTVNLPPVARPDSVAGPASAPIAGNVLADNGFGADSDPEGGALTVTALNNSAAAVGTAVTLASGAELTLQASGLFTYDPAGAPAPGPGETLSDSFTYTIRDAEGLAASASVSVTREGAAFREIFGTPGKDMFDLGPDQLGPDLPVRIFGDDGDDTARFGAEFAGAEVGRVEGGFRIETADGGVIEVIGVETLIFGDTGLLVDQSLAAAQAALLFEVLLDRAIDPLGLANYKAQIEGGRGLAAIGDEIFGGDEAMALFGIEPTPFMTVDRMFMQGLERPVDMGGEEFYVPRLTDGTFSEGDVAVSVALGPEAAGVHEDILSDGVLIAFDEISV